MGRRDIVNRRDFLNLTVTTAAAAALAGCGHPAEPAFISQGMMPEFYLPGIAQWFATTCSECSAGCGLGVRIIGGRAKKVEGIESHPLSRGGHCLRAETSLQALYNPDRLNRPLKREGSAIRDLASWDEPLQALAASFDQPNGLWITGPLHGTVGAMVVAAARASGARIWVLDFPGTMAERMAMQGLTGAARLPYYDIADADYVVNFGGDFLASSSPNNVQYGWQYGEFRNGKTRRRRGILVSFCSRMNMTVSNSDRWVPVRPGTEGLVAQAVAGLLGKGAQVSATKAAKAAGIDEGLLHRLADRLRAAKKAVAIGGFENTAYSNGVSSMAAIASLNQALSGGKHPTYEPDMLIAPPGQTASVPADLRISARQAITGLRAGKFATIWVNDVNPVYLLPQDKLGVAAALGKAHTFVFTPFVNETSVIAEWVLPTTSMLEQWADVRVDGPNPVYGLQQPVAIPLAGSKAFGDILLAAFAGSNKLKASVPKDAKKNTPVSDMKDVLSARFAAPDWIRALERGGVYKNATMEWSPYPTSPMYPAPPPPPTAAAMPAGVPFWTGVKAGAAAATAPRFSGNGKYVLVPYPSPVWGDGSISNRPWVPELPDPMTEAVWTTWIEINPETCKDLGLETERSDLGFDEVEVQSETATMRLAVIPTPAIHPAAVGIPMGLGHTSFGRYAYNKGQNPMNLVTPSFQDGSDEFVWAGTTVSIKPTGRKIRFATYDWRPYGSRELFEGHASPD